MLYSPVPSPLYYFNNINDNALEYYKQPYEMIPQRENNELEMVLPQIFQEQHPIDDTELKSNDYNKPNKSQDEQLNENNFKTIDIKGKNTNIQSDNLNFNGNAITRATSNVLGIKTKRSGENIQENGDKKKGGRKKKDEKEKGDHTKFCEDNLMRKIKSNFLEYIHNNLNKSFQNKNYKFLRLYSNINENLKKDYNMDLMKKTIKELYENSPISCKYRKQKNDNSDINKKLIQQIYNEQDVEKKEFEVINLLNLTYLDLLKLFRTTYLSNFLDKIAKEEKSKKETEENIQCYVRRIKELCLDYENWFEKKNGRKRN